MVGTLHSGLETGRELIDRSQLQPMLVSRPFLPVGLKLRAATLRVGITVCTRVSETREAGSTPAPSATSLLALVA